MGQLPSCKARPPSDRPHRAPRDSVDSFAYLLAVRVAALQRTLRESPESDKCHCPLGVRAAMTQAAGPQGAQGIQGIAGMQGQWRVTCDAMRHWCRCSAQVAVRLMVPSAARRPAWACVPRSPRIVLPSIVSRQRRSLLTSAAAENRTSS
jgi:hypothetical protein